MPSFGKDLAMPGKGGARHETKPWVDVGLLYKCLEKHYEMVADMGSYEHLNSSAAPNAKALLQLKDLWVGLLELSPAGSIHCQPLRQALISLLAEKPDLNQGRHNGGVWANLKIERFNCILTHVRKLGRNRNALGPAVSQLTKNEYTNLLAGLEKLQLPPEKKASPKKRKAEEDLEKSQVGTVKSKRKLKPRDSEVSMDSKGVPALFNSNSPFGKEGQASSSPFGKEGQASSSSGLKKPAAADSQLASLQRPGSRLFASMGYGLEKPLPGKAKPKVLKRPSKPLERGTTPGKRQPWEHLCQTDANNPPRSYIQGNVEGGKKHMIVQVTAHQSENYKGIVGKLRGALEKDSLTKEEALEMRDELLAKECTT